MAKAETKSPVDWLNCLAKCSYSPTHSYDESLVILQGQHYADYFYFNRDAPKLPPHRCAAFVVWKNFEVILCLEQRDDSLKSHLVSLKGRELWDSLAKEPVKPTTGTGSKPTVQPDAGLSSAQRKQAKGIGEDELIPDASGYKTLEAVIERMLKTKRFGDGGTGPRVCLIMHTDRVFAEEGEDEKRTSKEQIRKLLRAIMINAGLAERGHLVVMLRDDDPQVKPDQNAGDQDGYDVFMQFLSGAGASQGSYLKTIPINHSREETDAFLARRYASQSLTFDVSYLKRIEEFSHKYCNIHNLNKLENWLKDTSGLLKDWHYASSREERCRRCGKRLPDKDDTSCEECNERVRILRVLACGGQIFSEWNFARIAGLTTAKKTAKLAIEELLKDTPQIARVKSRYMLLFGPPGTGKTTMAFAISGEYKLVLKSINAGIIGSTFVDGRAINIRRFFVEAREEGKCIVLLDELEQIAGKTTEYDTEMMKGVQVLKEEMGGAPAQGNNFYMMGGTNSPWAVEKAVWARFGEKYYVGLPEQAERTSVLKNELGSERRKLTELDIEEFASRLTMATGRDISQVVERAKGEGALTPETLLESARQQSWSATVADLEEMAKWATEAGVSQREIEKIQKDIERLRKAESL
ncbi:MAG: ATP-binding protein [Chloroflexi bacterium]|nr:ATP-binding protein [Chloroflexota bacterium]